MTAPERRASLSLAFIYAMRMLGLFLVLPVFALEAAHYPGGDDPARVGLAMGVYGLTQGLLQLPFGMASDRLGRKPVIVAGLLVFAAGSAVAALAQTLDGLIIGRCLQGAGAVSAAVTALLSDLTRDAVRTKAMALVGASIGLMFALSLVLAPALAGWGGLPGLFGLTVALALGAVAVILWLVPPEPPRQAQTARSARGSLRAVLAHGPTLRLNFGVFVLHAVMLAMWVAVPQMLVGAGLAKAHHWWIYLPTIGASFLVMGATLFPMERRGRLRIVYLGAVALIGLAYLGLAGAAAWQARDPGAVGLGLMGLLLFLFFCASNILEASQPSIASRAAPPGARGAALGLYNTLQSLGFFAGGAAGGLLLRAAGAPGLFLACAAAIALWFVVAWPMNPQALARPAGASTPGT